MSMSKDNEERDLRQPFVTEDQLSFFEQDNIEDFDKRTWLEWFGLVEVEPKNLTVVEDFLVEEAEPSYKTWKDVPRHVAEEIFAVWQEVHSKKRAVLSEDRLRAILKAVAGFGRETVLNAIHGASLSPWHMGKNPSGKKYNDISLILRNAEKIEGFAELWVENRSAGGFLDER